MLGVLNIFNIIPAKQDLYDSYFRQVRPLLARYQAHILFYGTTRIVCLGDYHQEYFGLVMYPDMAAVKGLSSDPEFKRIRRLRDNSTTDFEMVILDEITLDSL